MQHSQNHPVVTTGRRAITLCRPSSSSHDSHISLPFMSESPVFEKLHIFHPPNSHEAHQFAHSPTLPKSEAVAPRYTWEAGTTAQSPSRSSDVLPSSRMSSANNVLAEGNSLHPSSGRRARRRDPGKAQDSTFSGPSSCPRESPTSTLHYGQTIGKPANAALAQLSDNPLTKIDNAAALSTTEATENTGTGPGSSRARPKDQSLRSLKLHHVLTEGVTVFVCTPEDLASESNRIDATFAPRLP